MAVNSQQVKSAGKRMVWFVAFATVVRAPVCLTGITMNIRGDKRAGGQHVMPCKMRWCT